MPTNIRIKQGLSRKNYAIFDNIYDAQKWEWLYYDCRPVSFGNYDNAFELQHYHVFQPRMEDDAED